MSTALAVTQQQSIEVSDRSRARIHNMDRCPRCSGLMVAEWYQDLSDYCAQRCVQCGEVIDPVILRNRGALQGPMTTESYREDVAEPLRDERSIERWRRNVHGVSRWGG